MMKYLFGIICLCHMFFTWSQDSLSGEIMSKKSGLPLIYAHVQLLELNQTIQTDQQGKFEFTLPGLTHATLFVQLEGYESMYYLIDTSMKQVKIYMESIHVNDVDEVIVDSKLSEINNRHLFHVDYYRLNELGRGSQMNLMDALANIPGVYNSSTGNGISKPVIRGMQGMRVVTFLNGVRLEGQQWGGDHGIGISDLGIGSVELVKGPASILYGADALGGVLYLVDEPFLPQGKQKLKFEQTYHRASLGTVYKLEFKKTTSKYRSYLGTSFASHADFQLPSKKYAFNSRFQEVGLKGSLSWNKKGSIQTFRFFSNNIQTGIPGDSEDSTLVAAGFQSFQRSRNFILPLQKLRNHSISYEQKWFKRGNEWFFITSQSLNQLMEFEDDFALQSMYTNLWSTFYHVKWNYNKINRLSLMSGSQGMLQNNRNNPIAIEQLIPNAHTLDFGIYSTAKYEFTNQLEVSGGLRWDVRNLFFEDSSVISNTTMRKRFLGVNGSLGFSFKPNHATTFQGHISSGYRAPHLSELLANGFHHGALRYEIGFLNLTSEKAVQTDLSWEISNKHLEFIINPFMTFFNNYIYLNPTDSMIENMRVYRYEQTGNIRMYGFEARVHYHPHQIHNLHFTGEFSYLRFSQNNQYAVSFVPQPRISYALKYQLFSNSKKGSAFVNWSHTMCFQQDQVASFESTSRFYQRCDASVIFMKKLSSPIEFECAVKNLFNASYIDHLSRLKNIGMPSQGRSFVLRIAAFLP